MNPIVHPPIVVPSLVQVPVAVTRAPCFNSFTSATQLQELALFLLTECCQIIPKTCLSPGHVTVPLKSNLSIWDAAHITQTNRLFK